MAGEIANVCVSIIKFKLLSSKESKRDLISLTIIFIRNQNKNKVLLPALANFDTLQQ